LKRNREYRDRRWLVVSLLLAGLTEAQAPPTRITLEEAIGIALRQNHSLLAIGTTVQQNQAQEVTANLRPNPTLFGDWEYLPITPPPGGWGPYLHDLSEIDAGLSYTIERVGKRKRRLQAAKDATSITPLPDRRHAALAHVSGRFFIYQRPTRRIDGRSGATEPKEFPGHDGHRRQAVHGWRH
jgi:hypothetical protein